MPFLYTDGWGKLLICLLTYLLAAYGVARKGSKRTRISQMQRIGLFTDRFTFLFDFMRLRRGFFQSFFLLYFIFLAFLFAVT